MYSANYADTLKTISAIMGTYSMAGTVCLVLQIVATWKLFTKMGEAGWRSIIPFHNDYVMTVRTWKASPFWITFACFVICTIFSCLAAPMATSEDTMVISAILFFIALGALLVGFIFSIRKTNHISKAFGHGVGFTLGLLFLPPIFLLILAFGSSKYEGPVE